MSDTTAVTVAEQRNEAREVYRQSLAAEMPLTGRQLGEMFGRSARWGVARVNEVRSESATPDAIATEPPAAAAPAKARVPIRQPGGAAVMAWLALGLGIVASIAANVGHMVYVVGPSLPGGTSWPAVAAAAFWPVALAISVEVMARVNWPDTTGYTIARFGGVGAVAAVAAFISYRHMSGLLAHWGEDAVSAHVGPLGVDGLIVVGGFALLAISNTRTHRT